MSARVILSWVAAIAAHSTIVEPLPLNEAQARELVPLLHDWRVWVETADGRYELAGTFAGTEGEAVAAALDSTGAERGFAVCDESILSTSTTLAPETQVRLGAGAPGGHPDA